MAQLHTTSLLLSTNLETTLYSSCGQQPVPTNGYTSNTLRNISNTRQLSLQVLVVLRVCIIYDQIVSRNRQQVIRPLLGLSRGDVTRLCANWNLPVYPDVTNEKLQFLRNRLRKQLFPLLRCLFNPRLDKSLFQCSELMVREQLLTETILAKRRHDHGCNGLSETDSLDIVGFSPGIFPIIPIRRPLGFFEGPLIINEIDEGRGWPTNPWPTRGWPSKPLIQRYPQRTQRVYMPSNVNLYSKQVVKSPHCLFLPKIGCYFLL